MENLNHSIHKRSNAGGVFNMSFKMPGYLAGAMLMLVLAGLLVIQVAGL